MRKDSLWRELQASGFKFQEMAGGRTLSALDPTLRVEFDFMKLETWNLKQAWCSEMGARSTLS
jgi:hypothetical protein